MRMIRSILALVALAAVLASTPARACDCPFDPPARAFERADAVFEGEVIAIGPSPYANRPCAGLCPNTAVRMRVVRSWKGSPPREAVLYTDLGTDCGYEFRIGTSYLVYASSAADGAYFTSICMRTTPMDRAQEDLRSLRARTRR